jgi:hypothetical protein
MIRIGVAAVAFLSLVLSVPAFAADMTVPHARHYHHHSYRLPPERHVVEKVSPPGSGIYLLNGAWFAALSPRCAGWVAGDRVRLVAGEPHGYCRAAVVRNLSRGMTCKLACRAW